MTLKIVHRNDKPANPTDATDEDTVDWHTEIIPAAELLRRLSELSEQGWFIHTVQKEYNQLHGQTFWILALREE